MFLPSLVRNGRKAHRLAAALQQQSQRCMSHVMPAVRAPLASHLVLTLKSINDHLKLQSFPTVAGWIPVRGTADLLICASWSQPLVRARCVQWPG
jgi:hypothetical protein